MKICFIYDKVQINISRSERERERERESSLSSVSSLKKSFTLIELSIVLLILSLLVGSLLVGRQIVDRAKIQRIIFEFDYYEKAFHQFYDTYRVVPGNLDEKTCNKWKSIFTKGCDGKQCEYTTASQTSSIVLSGTFGGKLNYSYQSKRAMSATMLHMLYARLIDFTPFETGSTYGTLFGKCKTDGVDSGGSSHALIGKFLPYTTTLFPQTSFDHNTYVKIYGMNFKKAPNLHILVNSIPDEFTTKQKEAIDMKNTIIFFIPFQSVSSAATAVGKDPNVKNAPINAKLMSELDAKIDDGRPWTGRLVGIKTIYGYLNTDQEVCYDNNGLYLNKTASKNGCNLIYAMEDVK